MCAPHVIEACRVLRFLLWALRAARAAHFGDEHAQSELELGLHLVGASPAAESLQGLTVVLAARDWPPTAWHSPRCCCLSSQEALVLRALGGIVHPKAGTMGQSACWQWLMPGPMAETASRAARAWLEALSAVGIAMPDTAVLEESLVPIERVAEPAQLH
jgi:hypothetical protein